MGEALITRRGGGGAKFAMGTVNGHKVSNNDQAFYIDVGFNPDLLILQKVTTSIEGASSRCAVMGIFSEYRVNVAGTSDWSGTMFLTHDETQRYTYDNGVIRVPSVLFDADFHWFAVKY